MATVETESRCTARARVTPAGSIQLLDGCSEDACYGPIDLAWFPDRLEITVVAAGSVRIVEAPDAEEGRQDVVIEIRPPSLDALLETVPGAD
jgi:hypothetical protein